MNPRLSGGYVTFILLVHLSSPSECKIYLGEIFFFSTVNKRTGVFNVRVKISRCKEFQFGDLLSLVQDQIESSPGQIEVNIGKLREYGKLEI